MAATIIVAPKRAVCSKAKYLLTILSIYSKSKIFINVTASISAVLRTRLTLQGCAIGAQFTI
jgi:hypothetical protein